MTPAGLPHSEISGSKRACRSPKLIAACYVLHRLSVPRHPPSTLSNLTIKCLELMRSADKRPKSLAHHHYNPYSIVNERTSIAEINAWKAVSGLPTAHLRGIISCGGPHKTDRLSGVFSGFRAPEEVPGGADRDRTDDPLLAKQVLSQLSYSPGPKGRSQKAEGRSKTKPSDFCFLTFWWA
jgi:hypothetical protein